MSYYMGLMSGTSIDGIDAVLIHYSGETIHVKAHAFSKFPNVLEQELLTLQSQHQCSLSTLGRLDHELGHCYADSVLKLLKQASLSAEHVVAIGSHGQTIFHHPQGPFPFTLQIGDPNLIAACTNIPVVADFRRMDIAHGGEGAPLAPLLHRVLFFQPHEIRVIVNLGGIANMTVLDPGKPVIGFDNGPANCLMDGWMRHHHHQAFDHLGEWAASGHVDESLLDDMLSDAYFNMSPPKSTGKELFSMQWLHGHLAKYTALLPRDVQATLCELTVVAIAQDLMKYVPDVSRLYVCGGGAHNRHIMHRLTAQLSKIEVATTRALGMPVDHVEAVAFALLAHHRMNHRPGNVPSVTGAHTEALLGGIYQSRPRSP